MNQTVLRTSYKEFELVSQKDIPDCSSVGVHLRHKQTGLEVIHLQNDDEENLFAFAFRTPVKNSTGAAHILEHSVFCGSERYPLKEPFTTMMNQSVNTFLNAMTYYDKTVYPSASIIKKDYFNLMSVYGDAVFFPLLKKEAFLQEAHRLELSEEGASVQGVVYNEMKGVYSSFESVAADAHFKSLFAGTNYEHDSGGDPLCITDFSYEDFVSFHKKYYRPENCVLFLYGNISTAEQLDFIQTEFIDRWLKKYSKDGTYIQDLKIPSECAVMETSCDFGKEKELCTFAPSTGATGSTVTINWIGGQSQDLQSYIEAAFLAEVLCGHDGSPLSKALIDSELGDDLAPSTGVSNETRHFTISFGLHGVKPKNAKKVHSLILSTLEDLCKNNVRKSDIDSALMSAEFANREVFRSGGPHSLILLERVLNGWNYGKNPLDHLLYRDAFEKIRANVQKNDQYVVSLIRRFLLDNCTRVFAEVRPSDDFLEERRKKEAELVERLERSMNKETVLEEARLLFDYQSHKETEEELSCIPPLALSDLKTSVEQITTEVRILPKTNIPLFVNKEHTNGVAYLEVCFPLDSLLPEDYQFLPFLSYCASNAGWNGKSWAECADLTAVHTGGIFTRLLTSAHANTPRATEHFERLLPYQACKRDYLIFSVRTLEEKIPDALKLFAECLSTVDFSDTKRIKKLLAEAVGAIKSSVVPKGHRYAVKRVQRLCSHSLTLEELWNGISQLFFMDSLTKMNAAELSKRLLKIKETVFKSGAIIHLTADEKTAAAVEAALPEFVSCSKIFAPTPKKEVNDEVLQRLTILPGEPDLNVTSEAFTVDAQVGFSALTMPAAFFGQKENVSQTALSHWLSGNSLWERIRTKGGAYGASASTANLNGLFTFSSFRDPEPENSVRTYIECLKDFSSELFDETECSRCITGTYGDEVQPHSPYARGNTGFFRTLYGVTEEDRTERLKNLLSLKAEELKASAKMLFQSADLARAVIITNKIPKTTSVIVKLPL